MPLFLLGFELVYAAAFVAAILSNDRASRVAAFFSTGASPMSSTELGAMLLILPGAAAILTADLIQRRSPRQAFDPRVRRPIAITLRGLCSGAASALISLVAVIYADGRIPDAVITGSAAVLCTLPAILTLPRTRRGRCIHCNYDLHGATPNRPADSIAARCPECGAVGSG